MADFIKAELVGTPELRRRLEKMNPAQNRRITTPALIESMQTTLRDAALNQIIRGGDEPPRADKLTSRTGTLRRSLVADFAIDVNERLRFVDGGTHLRYGAVHENSPRAFLKPALRDTSPRHEGIFVKHWRRAGEVS